MTEQYTKLFNTIVTSTIWQEDKDTKILWITMLAIADFDGKVSGSIPGIANIAGLTIEECNCAMNRLKSPDPYSRTQDFEGRRIQEVEGGWIILNHAKYRSKGKSRKGYYKDWRTKIAQHCATQTETDTETDTEIIKDMAIFDRARKLYRGFKRGNEVEFKNFVRHKDWQAALPLLYPAIEAEIAHKQALVDAKRFCPEWAHFATWINQRRWTQEFPAQDKPRTGSEMLKDSLI